MKSKYWHHSSKQLLPLLLISVILLTTLIGSINKLWGNYRSSNEYKHTYLVKLRYLPTFIGDYDWGGTKKILLDERCDENFSELNFNSLLYKNDADFEDLYPDSNTGELGKWIIVRSRKPIMLDLWSETSDVTLVEDANLTLKLPEDGEEFSVYINGIDTIKDDKTWGLRLPKVKEALEILKPIRKVVVAVVDTGCDLKHPALKDNLIQGRNFAGGDANDASNRKSYELHATHVTGTIVSKLCNKSGFFGIAQSVANVMPIRVLDESGSGTLLSVCRGIEYATKNGANVINMSLGTTQYSRALEDATTDAINSGVTVVCAKGNANTNKPHYPSDLPGVIRVTATSLKNKDTEERAYFSNYGENSTCSAPGHFIFSALPDGKGGFLSGTSMASPHAAACAAVILSMGDFTPKQVEEIMKFRGDDIKTDRPIGKRINLLNFVQKAKHDLMSPSEYNNHRYDRCCAMAGIISRMTLKVDGATVTNIYEDSDGKYDATVSYNEGSELCPVTVKRNKWGEDFLTVCRYKENGMQTAQFWFSQTSPIIP